LDPDPELDPTGSIRQRYGSADPDPHQNVTDPPTLPDSDPDPSFLGTSKRKVFFFFMKSNLHAGFGHFFFSVGYFGQQRLEFGLRINTELLTLLRSLLCKTPSV
jgi:hypothetical protein